MAALSEIKIGNNVMFGPEVVVIGGGHNISVPGRFMAYGGCSCKDWERGFRSCN